MTLGQKIIIQVVVRAEFQNRKRYGGMRDGVWFYEKYYGDTLVVSKP